MLSRFLGRRFIGNLRKPAVAGSFYPSKPDELEAMVEGFLSRVRDVVAYPKAMIAPHAGYIYSGPVAATAYAAVRKMRDSVFRVVLLGPSHWHAFSGLALPRADHLMTPLGMVPLDQEAVSKALQFSQVSVRDHVYDREHSLEVHLPFLQVVLGEFVVIPLLASRATPSEVSEVLEALWGDDSSLLVISSDLSHFHDYDTAVRLDRATSGAIRSLELEAITPEDACGSIPIRGLLKSARLRRMEVDAVDLRNSGDTAGPRDQVVGYGSFVFY